MKHGEQYIEPNNNFYRPSRDPNEGTMTLVVVITLLFVCQYECPFFVTQRLAHVDVLRPSACNPLIEQNLVAYKSGFVCLKELWRRLAHQVLE